MKEGAIWPVSGDGVPARATPRSGAAVPPSHAQERPPPAARVASTEDLARIAADQCPDASAEAADWFFGPWADTALPRSALAMALANHGLTDRAGETSAERWLTEATPEDRAAVRAAGRAPLGLWRITRAVGDRVWLEDRIGLAPGWAPDGPVRWEDAGPSLIGRAVPTAAGWVLTAATALPTDPPRAQVERWTGHALAIARERRPQVTIESALARHGDTLCRAAFSHAWGVR